MKFQVIDLVEGPIITADLSTEIGNNINGPSLIRVPDWIENPLGSYYLHFAHHSGQFIRMAYANDLCGPWHYLKGGTLHVDDCLCDIILFDN